MPSESKKHAVNELKRLVKEYPIIGVVNVQNLPAPQLQQMKRALRGKIEMRMARRRLLRMALEGCGKGVEKLVPQLVGMPALLFTKENPFSLYRIAEKNKSNAPAKAGQVAPKDLVIPAGPTQFAPGPVIGELGALGLKTGVEGGKIVIKQDHVVCAKGSAINQKTADVLKRFNIEPMEIGLNIVAVLEGGIIFTGDELKIDETAFNAKLTGAINEGRNLAVETCYPANEIIELLIQKAFREAKAVALESGTVSSDTIDEILGKGEREALAIQALVGQQ